jgi:hypothetical protein
MTLPKGKLSTGHLALVCNEGVPAVRLRRLLVKTFLVFTVIIFPEKGQGLSADILNYPAIESKKAPLILNHLRQLPSTYREHTENLP